MSRHQTGYIFESKSGAYHVRYYTTEIVDGQPQRVQKSHLLCRKDNKHFSRTCKAVKLLRDDFMRTINVAQVSEADMLVTDFWEQRYTGAIIDLKSDEIVAGKKVYEMPAVNYEQAFDDVCKIVDEHPELWNRPSREAVTFAVNALWKRNDSSH